MREEEGRGSWERPSGPCWLRGAGRGQELRKAVGEVGEGDSRLGPTSTGRGSDHSLCEQREGRLWNSRQGRSAATPGSQPVKPRRMSPGKSHQLTRGCCISHTGLASVLAAMGKGCPSDVHGQRWPHTGLCRSHTRGGHAAVKGGGAPGLGVGVGYTP